MTCSQSTELQLKFNSSFKLLGEVEVLLNLGLHKQGFETFSLPPKLSSLLRM